MPTIPPVETAVARLVTELDYDALPPEAERGARRLMQDQLAVQVGCAPLPWSQAILDLTRRRHVPGTSRVTGAGDRMSPAAAAFVNATFGHGFEYDDAHRASSSHPGSCVVSTALAVGEEIGATMREVLLGIVAGYEVYTRIGVLAAPDLLERGFHPHAILSPFGAAAVVAKMRGFDLEHTIHALAIAMSHCSGTTEYSSSGGSVKRVHAGIGTRNGIRAAEMAEAGITARWPFSPGPRGSSRPSWSGRWTRPPSLGIQTGGNVVVGTRNVNAYAPKTIENLQYSLPFQFALALLGYGNGFTTHHDFLAGRLDLSDGSRVAELASRVRITLKPELDAAYPGRWIADIAVTYRDGTRKTVFVDNPLGTAENPMSQEDLDAKFSDLVTAALGPERGETLLRAITDGDLAMPASALVDLLISQSVFAK